MKHKEILSMAKNKTPKEEKVKLRRLLIIDEELRSGHLVTATSLAEKIENVSPRTIQRDIEEMRLFHNAPIEWDNQRKTYYYSEPNFFIKSIQMTEGELFSVALFDQLLEQYRNTPIEKNVRNIFRKIVSSLPNEITVDSSFLDTNTTFIPDQIANMEEYVFTTVFQTLKKKTTLEFDYRPLQKTSFMTRQLDPYHAVCQKGCWYIIGYCHDKNEVRVFNFSRMKNVRDTEQKFEVPLDFSPDKYFDKEIGVWLSATTKNKVELLISKEIGTFALERRWNSNQVIKQNDDGSVYVSFETTQLPEVKRWVLGQGKTVTVLGPGELREEIVNEIDEIRKNYL